MATVKMKQIKKTVAKAVDYVVREDATKGGLYVSSNFTVAPTGSDVARQFYITANSKGTGRGNVLAHHVMQNFKPGEVSLETAHEMGVEFAEKITGGKHEYVIATHSDKGHFHNHIIFNAVNMDDGRKFRVLKSTIGRFRDISDEMCQKRGLSVLPKDAAEKSRGKTIGEVRASEAGRSWKDQLKADLAEVARTSANWWQFTKGLEARGIAVNVRGSNVSFTPEGRKRPVRGARLGQEYTKAALEQRLGENARGRTSKLMERIQDKLMGRKDNISDGAGGTRAAPEKKQRDEREQRKANAKAARDQRLAAARAQAKEKQKREAKDRTRDRDTRDHGRTR